MTGFDVVVVGAGSGGAVLASRLSGDASVMPDIPRANTHLTTVAIAEKVAASMRSRTGVAR